MDFIRVVEIATKFAGELPAPVTRALSDVEILVCEDVEKAAVRLEELMEEKLETALPADLKGVFIGEPMEVEESDESEQEEVTLDPSGFIVLVAANLKDEEEAGMVLLHECGHAMGWDEEELKKFGVATMPSSPDGKQSSETPTAQSA